MAENKIFKPELLMDTIREGLKENVSFGVLAKTGFELEGRPGETVTMSQYTEIGGVQDNRQSTDAIVFHELSTNEIFVPIKEMAIGAQVKEIDEIQGLGSVKNEASRQMKVAIANALDTNVYNAALGLTDRIFDVSAELENNTAGYVSAVTTATKLKRDEGLIYWFINPDQSKDILLDPYFQHVNTYNGEQVNTALAATELGKIHNLRIFTSDKIVKDANGVYSTLMGTSGAVMVEFQKRAKIHEQFDIDFLKYKFAASVYYALGVINPSKLAVLKTK